MKRHLSLLVLFLGMIPLLVRAQPATPDEFMAAIKTAMKEKSVEKLTALTYTVGMGDSDKQMMEGMEKNLFVAGGPAEGEITGMSLGPIPSNTPSGGIMNGRKYEMTHAPTGQVVISYKGTGSGALSMSLGYALIDGKYFLISAKSTDLGWKGPADQSLIYMVACQHPEKVQVTIKWNVSGVDQEQTLKGNSGGVMGQYFEKVTVTGADDEPGAILTLSKGGQQIFASPPLAGKGAIEYKKE
jgi:hypothetical protein